MHKLDKLLMEQEQRDIVASYGIDPTAIETWLQDRERTYRDPTADAAIAAADRDLARRRKAKR